MTAAEKLTSIIAHLDGPAVSPTDIEWAVALPAGERLMEWLGALVDEEGDDALDASLATIALEREEVTVLKYAQELGLSDTEVSTEDADSALVPPPYARPSELRTRTDVTNSEAALLEAEIARLQHRLRATKMAYQKTIESVQNLRHTLADAKAEGKRSEERLEELSIKADTALDASIDSARRVLSTLSSIPPPSQSALASRTALRSSLTAGVSPPSRNKDPGTAMIPNREEIKIEGARLQRALPDVDVRGILERAWAADQAEALQEHGKMIDLTFTSFQTILPTLSTLHGALSARTSAQAGVGALGEELLDLLDDLDAAEEWSAEEEGEMKGVREKRGEVLEKVLKGTIRELKDLRPENAPPLVLLDRSDILAELQRVTGDTRSRGRHNKWGKELKESLGSLSNAHAPVLTVYAPLPTLPPFALSPHLESLHEEANGQARRLGEVIVTLENGAEGRIGNIEKKRKER